MISRYAYKGLTWIDLESPNREEIALLEEEFSLPSIIGEEILSSTLNSRVDLYEHFIYLILHFPTITGSRHKDNQQEVDFIIGKDFLITVRYDMMDPIHEFATMFEANTKNGGHARKVHAGYIFTDMMKQFYRHSLKELEDITADIHDIEERIFEHHGESMVKEISITSRRLLDFKQAIRFHRNILQSFQSASTELFGEDFGYYSSLITAEYNKVDNLLESHRDTLSELQRTNDSLLTTRSNEIMKNFTIMTFVMLPLTLITGVFGMNTLPDMIMIRNFNEFFFIIGVMVLIAVTMYIYFRHRKWI